MFNTYVFRILFYRCEPQIFNSVVVSFSIDVINNQFFWNFSVYIRPRDSLCVVFLYVYSDHSVPTLVHFPSQRSFFGFAASIFEPRKYASSWLVMKQFFKSFLIHDFYLRKTSSITLCTVIFRASISSILAIAQARFSPCQPILLP